MRWKLQPLVEEFVLATPKYKPLMDGPLTIREFRRWQAANAIRRGLWLLFLAFCVAFPLSSAINSFWMHEYESAVESRKWIAEGLSALADSVNSTGFLLIFIALGSISFGIHSFRRNVV